MANRFFEHPILNSPYECPRRHWELDNDGQPTQQIVESRRKADFITPIPKPRKREDSAPDDEFVLYEGHGLSTAKQQYDPTSIINEVRGEVARWRSWPNPSEWQVTPETARLLLHWRNHPFAGVRPFFCQVEAVETVVWLTEVAPQSRAGRRIIEHLAAASKEANPELARVALKLATGAGKTTVIAMLIAWQTINAARRLGGKRFTRGFLVVAPGLTIKDRLRVLMPNDPDSDYASRELVPGDMLDDLNRAKIVITNYHAFKLRERLELSAGGRALRRQSYDLNEEGLFNVEYADVFGIPFDFTAQAVVAPPQPPRETIQVKAVRPERDALEIRFPRVEGYRVELPNERLAAQFNEESVLTLTPDMVGPSITQNAGIIGEGVDLTLTHLADTRTATVLYHLTKHLLYKWRDPGGEANLNLFGQLKTITREWLDECLVCKGGTFPAQLIYQELADRACERITAAITRAFEDQRPVKAMLDPYNPVGSTMHVRFNTSKTLRWQTSPAHRHVNWVILDSDWEGEFRRVAESHPRVRGYVKNHGLGFEIPYRDGSESRKYLPDFIVQVDDGRGADDLLHLVVEIKGFRREDAMIQKSTMEAYWIPGVNNLKTHGRWAFAEFRDIYEIDSDFKAKVESEFVRIIAEAKSP